MDKLDYVKSRVIKRKPAWADICKAGVVSQRTLYKIANGHLPSYKTVDALYNHFKQLGK